MVGSKYQKNTARPLLAQIMNLLVFFEFEAKKCFWVPTPWSCLERSGMSTDAVFAIF